MKKIILIISAILISLVGGCLLLMNGIRSSHSDVRVIFQNRSGCDVSEIEVKTKIGRFQVNDLKNGNSYTLTLRVQGEDGFKYRIHFSDGSSLTAECYVEGGYVVTVSIKKDKLEADYGSFY
jgi:hypothetical protein